jgi:hypothetical protein
MNKTIVTKAIRKAQKNGWDSYGCIDFDMPPEAEYIIFGSKKTVYLDTLLFDVAFAKALWGEEKVNVPVLAEWGNTYEEIAWKAHVKAMAVRWNRVKYLEENI